MIDGRSEAALPALPEVLSRVDFVDGPWLPENGRVYLLHDTAARRWGATARLAATGLRLGSVLECRGLLPGVGSVLAVQGVPGGVDRASVLLRSTGPERASPEHAGHEAFLTVSAPDAVLRRGAGVIGRAQDRRATALYAALSALSWPLQALGLDTPQWLDGPALVDALHTAAVPQIVRDDRVEAGRTGPRPVRPSLRAPRRRATGGDDRGYDRVGVPARVGGDAAGRSFVHDGYATVSWAALPAGEGPLPLDALRFVLAGPGTGERRSLAVHYQAAHPVRTDDVTGRGGSSAARTPARTASTGSVRSSPVRCGVVAAVTLRADGDVEAAADAVEAAASGRFALHRLELAQDSGFVAAALPVGIGLDHPRVSR